MRALILSLLAGLTVASPAGADQIRMFTRGDQSLAAHLLALKNAKQSIDVMAYEFKPCDSSAKAVIAVLAEKARKIPVRVIIDNHVISNAERRGLADYFASQNIQFKAYNTNFIFADHRSHIKLTVIDGKSSKPTYFADSSNFTDEYFGLNASLNYVNRDFMIRGASGRQAQAGFDLIWNSRMADEVRVSSNGAVFHGSCLRSNARDQQVMNLMNKKASSLAKASDISCSKVSYFLDDPKFLGAGGISNDRDNGQREEYMNVQRLKKKPATAVMLSFLEGVRSSLNMENQYYLPVYKVRSILDDLRERGVKIMVLTNRTSKASAGFSPILSHFILRAAARDSKGSMTVLPLASRGAMAQKHSLTQRGATWHLHSKTAVRDHKDIYISSFNIDARSYHTNLEYGVLVQNCPALAKAIERDFKKMTEIYMTDLANCKSCMAEDPNINPLQYLMGVLAGSFL